MPCDHCCLAELAPGVCSGGRYCELTNPEHPAHNPAYVEVLLVKAGLASRLKPRPVAGWQPPPAAETAPAPGPVLSRKRSGELLALRTLAADCLYASQSGWRGCGCRACWARGDALYPVREVSQLECLQCTAQMIPEPAESGKT